MTPHGGRRGRWTFFRARGGAVVALLAGLLLAVGAFFACADPPGNDPNVPDDEVVDASVEADAGSACLPGPPPSFCTDAAPSYATDIGPLVKRTCVTCHAPGGVASDRDLSTYKKLSLLAQTSYGQVARCLMPPADAGPDASLTLSERTELLQWIACGSPGN